MSETLDEIWGGDLLDRRKDADFLQKFLIAKSEQKKSNPESPSFALNIDQSWGAGKTFFLKRFKQQLEAEGHISCYINAWEDDFSEDPIIPILSALDEQLLPPDGKATKARKSFAKAARIIGKHLMHGIIRKTVAISVSEMTDELGNDDAADAITEASEELAEKSAHDIIDRFRENKQHINEFKEAFACVVSELAENGSKSPLFILIDELDRCRPTYAIALLERIKHLFSVEDVVFVLTTNKEQLIHSVGAIYGQNFDSSRYLNRFFDSTYRFTKPTIERYVPYLLDKESIDIKKLSPPPNTDIFHFISKCADAYNLTLRDIEQCIIILSSITSLWSFKSKIELTYLIPLIFSDHIGKFDEFNLLSPGGHAEWQYKWQTEYQPAVPEFTFKINTRNRKTRVSEVRIAKLSDLIDALLSAAPTPLNNLEDISNQTGIAASWAYQILVREFVDDHPTLNDSKKLIPSKILKYPDYVRHARLLTIE